MKNKALYQLAGWVMVLVMILGNTLPAQAAPAQLTGPTIYWGAMVDGKVPSSTNLSGVMATFETRAQKKMAIIHWGQPWKMSDGSWGEFQTSYFDNVRNHGSIPMINWASQKLGAGTNQSDFQLRDIYNGNYDTYIRRWATDAKNWGHPFFLRFNHEMNGWWYPWAEGKSNGVIVNGNSAGDYVKAWRHVHDIFVSVGAKNVTWVWAPNQVGSSTNYAALSTLYPGAAYVDWTALDVYNKYDTWAGINPLLTGSSGMTWYKNSYTLITNLAPYKPMMLAEVASIEAGDGGTKKAAWIKDALTTQIPTNFPKIKAVVYMNWDINAGRTYPIQSSTAATSAFAAAIGAGRYASNKFASLNTSPIPALSGATLSTTSTLSDSSAGDSTDTSVLPTDTTTAVPADTATPLPTDTATPEPAPTEASAVLPAIADSYIDSAAPDSAAGGVSTALSVSASPDQKAFLKFDLTSMAGKTISTVTLKLKTSADPSAGSANSLNVKLVSDVNWKEKYLSYNNTVAVSDTLLGTLQAAGTPGTWYEISLDPASLQSNLGGLLSLAIESTGPDNTLFFSIETADQPQLIITYK
jgi:beta-mannanase